MHPMLIRACVEVQLQSLPIQPCMFLDNAFAHSCHVLSQAVLSKSGKASVLSEMEENDPDAAGDDDDEEDEVADEDAVSDSLIDSVTQVLQKTGLTT